MNGADFGLPMVSIVMPSYNASAFIAESIESVLAQSYGGWELLITDDCSKDDSYAIAQRYAAQDGRVRSFRLEKNGGAAIARNYSLGLAAGRYVAFLDSDDLWKPKKLEQQLAFMQKTNAAFTYTDYELMSERGALLGKRLKMPMQLTYNQYLRNTAIGCLTVMVDRAQVGEFQMPNIRSSQDMATWLLILRRVGVAKGLRENLATYRLVQGSNSSKKLKAAKDVWRVYREIEDLGLLRSVFSFCGYAFNAVRKRL